MYRLTMLLFRDLLVIITRVYKYGATELDDPPIHFCQKCIREKAHEVIASGYF